MSKIKAIPDDYPRVNASLAVDGAADAIAFYTSVFGFTERMRMDGPGGTVAHAELQLGDSLIMLADEFPEMDHHGPAKYGGSPVAMHIYVEDVDAVYKDALAAGARSEEEPTDQFYGDRSAKLIDPFGHTWGIASHVEDISMEEMEERMASWTPDS